MSGFSLVELIVVIAITGVIASVIGSFISGPVLGFFDQARRAQLVDAGQLAFTRMGRDFRSSLPNSVRSSGAAVEMLRTLDGDRYRTEPAAAGFSDAAADNQLEFNRADTAFNTFRQLGAGQTNLPAVLRLAVFPLVNSPSADPYVGDATCAVTRSCVLTPPSVAVNVAAATVAVGASTEYRVTMNPGWRFPHESPSHRVFLVEGPVTWSCTGGDLVRYDGYAVQAAPPVPPTGGSAEIVIADVVQACTFTYDPGTAQRNAVVALTLELVDPSAPAEVVRLARQVHVGNVP